MTHLPENSATVLLLRWKDGDPKAMEELLPLVYDELRCVANHQMRAENAGQTLTATALVHEAYLRLTRGQPDRPWKGKRHGTCCASEFRTGQVAWAGVARTLT